jgi:hypothetical protein
MLRLISASWLRGFGGMRRSNSGKGLRCGRGFGFDAATLVPSMNDLVELSLKCFVELSAKCFVELSAKCFVELSAKFFVEDSAEVFGDGGVGGIV